VWGSARSFEYSIEPEDNDNPEEKQSGDDDSSEEEQGRDDNNSEEEQD
jgi:hypothetical protein